MKDITEYLREEIILRLNIETELILKMCEKDSDKEFLKAMLKQNNDGLKLINEFICLPNGGDTNFHWETFVKEKYWDKK